MNNKAVKIQLLTDYSEYKKGQIVELEEKAAISLLTNGKALKIHRKSSNIELVEEKTSKKKA